MITFARALAHKNTFKAGDRVTVKADGPTALRGQSGVVTHANPICLNLTGDCNTTVRFDESPELRILNDRTLTRKELQQ